VKQTSLESISLITGSGCYLEGKALSDVDLSTFHALKQISWIGLQSKSYIQALRGALDNNSNWLTHLRIEYVIQPEQDYNQRTQVLLFDSLESDQQQMNHRWPSNRNFFAHEILGLDRAVYTSEIMFPALISLSLGSIPLSHSEKALVSALGIGGLSHLSLRQCPFMNHFLKAILESGQSLSLSSLEYCLDKYLLFSNDEGRYEYQDLKLVFGLAPKLTDLFLLIPGPTDTLDLWRAIAHNRLPLRRFICHQRNRINRQELIGRNHYQCSNDEEDLTDLSFPPESIAVLDSSSEEHPFAHLNLLCLGLCCTPDIAVWEAPALLFLIKVALISVSEIHSKDPKCFRIVEAFTHQKIRLGTCVGE
jgi:hypothetical protein